MIAVTFFTQLEPFPLRAYTAQAPRPRTSDLGSLVKRIRSHSFIQGSSYPSFGDGGSVPSTDPDTLLYSGEQSTHICAKRETRACGKATRFG
jgi:hypothetical protein